MASAACKGAGSPACWATSSSARAPWARGSTLFLDEIGELPLELQPRLLRVLETRRVRRVGGGTELPVDLRVIAASHRNLLQEVERGKFRKDLYFRLAVVPVWLPPLRERRGDVRRIAERLLDWICPELRALPPRMLAQRVARRRASGGDVAGRSFDLPLAGVEPGSTVSSETANEQGPLLIQILGGVLAQLGIAPDPRALDAGPGPAHQPRGGFLDTRSGARPERGLRHRGLRLRRRNEDRAGAVRRVGRAEKVGGAHLRPSSLGDGRSVRARAQRDVRPTRASARCAATYVG